MIGLIAGLGGAMTILCSFVFLGMLVILYKISGNDE